MKCNRCGEEIPEGELLCPNCGKKVNGIDDLVGEAKDLAILDILNENVKEHFQKFRICKVSGCGHPNPVDSNICEECNELLNDSNSEIRLLSKVCTQCGMLYRYEEETCKECGANLEDICFDDLVELISDKGKFYVYNHMVIGRKMFPSTFPGFSYISRTHARFLNEKGTWYIVPEEKSTNPVYVNDKPIIKGEKFQIKNGDIIQFSKETPKFKFSS
ncbi:MAG TPA: zinc ribbon domain-containing protein [Fervidobacterium sp.]|nr:zinc ribbon domain-containing protein [Fervidobacterium sp.]